MARIDAGRAEIERNVTVPAISYDWSRDVGVIAKENRSDTNGLIDEWRKVRERIAARRSKHAVGSIMWKACENAIGLVRAINRLGQEGRLGERGDWVPGHSILERAATLFENRTGRIDPLVQAMLRDAMDEAYVSERFDR